MVPAVHARYPKMQLVFREEKTDAIVADLREGKLDAGLLALEADIGEWASGVVATDPFVVAFPQRTRWRGRRRSPRATSTARTCSSSRRGTASATRRSRLHRAGARTSDEAELRATSLSTLAQMVSAGACVTLLPRIAVPVENRRGQLEVRPFTSPAPHRTIALIWRPQSPFADTFRELADVFRAAVARSGVLQG